MATTTSMNLAGRQPRVVSAMSNGVLWVAVALGLLLLGVVVVGFRTRFAKKEQTGAGDNGRNGGARCGAEQQNGGTESSRDNASQLAGREWPESSRLRLARVLCKRPAMQLLVR